MATYIILESNDYKFSSFEFFVYLCTRISIIIIVRECVAIIYSLVYTVLW